MLVRYSILITHNKNRGNPKITESTGAMDVNVKQDEPQLELDPIRKTKFSGSYEDCMEMYAPVEKVAEYFNQHSSWFVRCAEPMKAIQMGEHGYILVIGRFGAFGYEVEPKIGLELLFTDIGAYHISTVPIADYDPGYEVDYQATMKLVEQDFIEAESSSSVTQKKMTRVEWDLNLTVELSLPKFIHRLRESIIQSTGDRLLNQIVRQISRRLTRKVQADFHQLHSLPFPPIS
jgi:hypothetical protein